MTPKILIIGACGQIGSELTLALRALYGNEQVIASDIREGNEELMRSGSFEILDATDKNTITSCVRKHKITDVYLMAAMLSATAEKYPDKAWDLNMNSLFHVLDLARDKEIRKVFWPSSIAVFGPSTPKRDTPQQTVMEPSTVYGISKLSGERWCEYYFKNYGVDVRSIRYPGLISWKTSPGGGTTDYAIEIYHKALQQGTYECFLGKDTVLPMMYMEDAIRATISIMQADAQSIRVRSSYNLAAISFDPEEMAETIKEHIPDFTISYAPDFRQKIADTWPQSIDDSSAREDWGWKARYDLKTITADMLSNLQSLV
ncbi:NAD-dependent epimerase/dehydratase family protein [Sinomicrobium pectinilyticum]|uniref:NAD-dependent epimerase/dehydratase family protein n=1 Tax=Sinomicrobium pectinilyticum TaxID=1084421 RepID=A0A3N0DYW4_SINP1|nr:NAD-dependent epimerase/dehydratase family protein [Sinomicrobium pectinilyticum]RNL80798.1 NAD-dependent epimerase/dehydratase family protein [Sinomicrobium pectinilyticum]